MERFPAISCIFLDIGGVLLTDGWDHHARKRAAAKFSIAFPEMNQRHQMAFASFEEGRITLQEYLDGVVFHQKRSFSHAQFQAFLFAQSKAHPQMIALARALKTKLGLKIVVVSNEARELNSYRIRRFGLNEFVDGFISSCFVRIRKPDADIFRLALDVAQVPPGQVAYIENTPMFVEVAEGLGIRGVLHTSYPSTRAKLASLGLPLEDRVVHEAS